MLWGVLKSVDIGEFGGDSMVACSLKNVPLNCLLFEGCLKCLLASTVSEKERISS